MNDETEKTPETAPERNAAPETARERAESERMISELKCAYESSARLRASPAHRKIALEIARGLKKK